MDASADFDDASIEDLLEDIHHNIHRLDQAFQGVKAKVKLYGEQIELLAREQALPRSPVPARFDRPQTGMTDSIREMLRIYGPMTTAQIRNALREHHRPEGTRRSLNEALRRNCVNIGTAKAARWQLHDEANR